MKTKISLFYKNAIVLPEITHCGINTNRAATVSAEMMRLGFVPTKDLLDTLASTCTDGLETIFNDLIPALKQLVGDDVKYKPMYPNFPKQVMEAEFAELFINAILHYWSYGEWKPEYESLPREFAFENVKFRKIGVISDDEFEDIFSSIVCSNESLTDTDKETIGWFVDRGNINFSGKIPFKENVCYVAGLLLKKDNIDISTFVDTATDVLRVVVAYNDGDISLATPTKFKSMPKPARRSIVKALERVANEEDINRHRGMWVRLFHGLHIGELGSDRLVAIAKKIRNNKKIETFNSKVEKALANGDISPAVALLTQRAGEFARRIDHLLRLVEGQNEIQDIIVDEFIRVADLVDTRVLLQLVGNLKIRHKDREETVVFPKGQVSRAQNIKKHIPALPAKLVDELKSGIEKILTSRFKTLDSLGKVWVDPQLQFCPIPTQMRSATTGLRQVGRGTRLPIGDGNTLRMFIYWIGRDIDLTASLHDEEFQMVDRISYTKLRSKKINACHSGDIVEAQNGASEFVDITIDEAINAGIRYVAMNVYVFAGPTFNEHKAVYAGWMIRKHPDSNEVYDPKTVEQKIDLSAQSKVNIPVIFDLVERKAIWTDISKQWRPSEYENSYAPGNNIENNKAGIIDIITAIVNKNNKINLFELFNLHAIARGELVDNKQDADTIFSINEGITPFDIAEINSNYIK